MKNKFIYLNFIGIILLVYIISALDFRQMGAQLLGTRVQYLLMAYPLIFVLIFLKSARWNIILRRQGVEYGFFRTFYVYLWAFYFGVFTPGRIGEAVKAVYVRGHFTTIGEAFVSVIVDRAQDVLVLIVCIVGLYPPFSAILHINVFFYAACVAGGIIAIGAVLKSQSARGLMIKLTKFIIPGKYHDSVKNNINAFFNSFLGVLKSGKVMVSTSIISFTAFLVLSAISYLILLSYNIEMSFLYVIFVGAVAGFAAIIPISISGLGVREAAMIFLFKVGGYTMEQAVMFSLTLFLESIILGLHGGIVNIIMIFKGHRPENIT